jgi:hypothetical protein
VVGDRRYGIYCIQHPEAGGIFVPNGTRNRWLYGRAWRPMGMNTAIGEAYDLGWKLAWVLGGVDDLAAAFRPRWFERDMAAAASADGQERADRPTSPQA